MPRPHPILLTLLAVSLAGCDGRPPTAPGADPAAAAGRFEAAQANRVVPFKEEYTASGTIAPSAACAAGTLQVALDGGGTASHVGRYSITNSHCLDLATGVFTNGTFVKTAANGDQLFGTYSGVGTVIVPPAPIGQFRVSGTLTFTGGTGRFAGLTGTASMSGVQTTDFSLPDFPTTVTLHMEGAISSVRSVR
jgi:hypothetical protein